MDIPILYSADFKIFEKFRGKPPYKAMYSSLWKGIVTDPNLMLIPIDDHLVHRGDGVFEAFRSHDRSIYDMKAHLERLFRSAKGIELEVPNTLEEIQDICLALGRASGLDNATFRLYVSRGPGGFTTNPYETIGAQLYIVVTESGSYAPKLYEEGALVSLSKYKTKETPFCHIKNCNYLINVLMKKEAVDSGVDYTVALDPNGNVAESSTENIALLTKDRRFLSPTFEFKLKGTTLLRCMELAKTHMESLNIREVGQSHLSPKDFEDALEVMMIGTTMGVMPVRKFEDSPLPPLAQKSFSKSLLTLLQCDIATNPERRMSY